MTARLALRAVDKGVRLPSGERLQLLREIGLQVQGAESVAIVGRSGSGKTTLLSVAGLLATPDSGTVEIDGESATGLSDARRASIRSARVGYVFQSYSLVPTLSAAENLCLPLYYGELVSRRERLLRADALLEELGLASKADHRPRRLSGGEQQRVAIGRALIRQPSVILADEPTGALDVATGESVIRMLVDVAARWDAALVVVTHDNDVAALADHIVTMSDGRLHAPAGQHADSDLGHAR